MNKKLPAMMWGGFVDDKLHVERHTDSFGDFDRPAIFAARAAARVEYSDVRRVEVREIKRRSTSKGSPS